jgi:succinoglycan biosynthesis protein ExoV
LWDDFPKRPTKHVIGSGFGGYTAAPDVHDGTWNIVWVRGPLTAAALGISKSLAIADPAVLLRAIPLPDAAADIEIAFMPHFQSIERGNWKEACDLAGITFLDPREAPLDLIAKIRGAKLVLTEAMHGAIVADALRTPFIPFVPIHSEHRMKWNDWAQSIDLELQKNHLLSSTLADVYIRNTRSNGIGPMSRFLHSNPALKFPNRFLTHKAAKYLQSVAENCNPTLSDDQTISLVTERCLDSLNSFVKSRL